MSELTPEAQALRKAQQDEYSAYVATEQIYIGGALAFNVGDPVPKGHVDRGVVRFGGDDAQVVKASSKAGAQAQAENPTSPKEK